MEKDRCWCQTGQVNYNAAKYYTMEQNKQPVQQYYYSEEEWSRLGCGPLPAERSRAKQKEAVIARANPKIDNNVVKGSN